MAWRNWWQKPPKVDVAKIQGGHVCSECKQKWGTEQEYLEHSCPNREGMRPTDNRFPRRS